MNLRIIAVGRLKESFYREAEGEFLKRLSRYGCAEVVEVADEKAPQRLSAADRQRVLEAEGERIQSRLRQGARLVALCIEGRAMTSEQLAARLADWALTGESRVDLVIGGSLGLAPRIKSQAELMLSFSPMTFSHQIFRIMLLEQLYRAAKINAGEPYHK